MFLVILQDKNRCANLYEIKNSFCVVRRQTYTSARVSLRYRRSVIVVRPTVDEVVSIELDAVGHPHVANRGVSKGGFSKNLVIACGRLPPAFLLPFCEDIQSLFCDTTLVEREVHGTEVCLNKVHFVLDIFRFFSEEFLLIGKHHFSCVSDCNL